jgi:6-phosphogluconolactonase
MLLSASYDGAIVGVNRIGFDGVAGELIHTLDTPPKAHSVIPSPDNRFAYAASLGGDCVLAWPMDPLTGLQADGIRQYALPAGAGPRHILFGAPGTLYAINEIDGTVAVFAHDGGTGALTLRQTLETAPQNGAGGAAAADIHLTPDGRLLYASIRSTNRIAAFRVSRADGTLEALGQYPVEDTPRAFAITPDGAFLVSAGRNSASVGLYAIDRVDGALAQVARYATGANPNWVEMVPLPE